MKVQHMVEFFYPGVFAEESDTRKITHSDPNKVRVPKNAYAFRLFDLVIQTATLEDGRTIEHRERQNESIMYYPEASILSRKEVEKLVGEDSILRRNMEYNNWNKVIKTRCGSYQPYTKKECQVL